MCCRKATSVDASAILLARRKRHFATGSNMASSSSSSSLKRNANVNANAKQVRGVGAALPCHLPRAMLHLFICLYIFAVYKFLHFTCFHCFLPWILRRKLYDVLCGESGCKSCTTASRGHRKGGGGDKLELQQSSAGFGLCGAHKFPFCCIVPLVPH